MIRTEKPFSAYVLTHELPKTGDSRRFELMLPYRVERTGETKHLRWSWSYSGTQEAVDQKAGVDGCKARHEQEMASFERWVERKLQEAGERLYAVEDEELLVRGKV